MAAPWRDTHELTDQTGRLRIRPQVLDASLQPAVLNGAVSASSSRKI
jgi:hypothetical protein